MSLGAFVHVSLENTWLTVQVLDHGGMPSFSFTK
jgi:hypothetical protein